MRQARILPLLGPAAVLYLVTDVASATRGLSPIGLALGAVALACAFAPVAVRSRADSVGARRAGALGVFAGIALVLMIEPAAGSLAIDVATAVAACVTGALVLDLALSTPDVPRHLRHVRLLRALSQIAALVAAALGLLAVLPPLMVAGAPLLLPARFELAPPVFLLAAAAAALAVRLARRRLGSGPEALAANAWGVMGLIPLVLVGVASFVFVFAGSLTFDSPFVRGAAALSALGLSVGHVLLVDSRRRLSAGPAARRVLTAAFTLGIISAAAGAAHNLVPREAFSLAAFAAASLLCAAAVHRALSPFVERLLSPFGGRLLSAMEEAGALVSSGVTLEDVARAVLPPMRRASGTIDATPYLYSLDPPREARIDAAGEPHVRSQPLPAALVEWVREHPGEVPVRDALEERVVRRPELRPVVEALVAVDALCAVPLLLSGDLEGLLLVPRGRRHSALTLEEIAALWRLADRLAGFVALLSAQKRAQRRAGALSIESDRLEERLDQAEEEIERLRAEADVLRAGRGEGRMRAPLSAYSEPMRALEQRIVDVAPMDAPVLLVAEGGSPVDQVARRIHGRSGRASGPFIVADCASVRPEDSVRALFGAEGDDAQPGWLRLSRGGSLLLADVPCLSLEAQRDLAEALAVRQARPVGGAGAYPVDVRVVATARLPLEPLVSAGSFDAELARWLGSLRLDVPSLRDRSEDIPSLVLLALDRACRVLGREVVGIEKPALDALVTHDWPGNLRELHHVVERAVARAETHQVRLTDLPPLGAHKEQASPPEAVLEGTWTEVEKRALAHALARAGGNKSEAARLLGLKRTTFLDKLRRYDLDASSRSASSSEDAA